MKKGYVATLEQQESQEYFKVVAKWLKHNKVKFVVRFCDSLCKLLTSTVCPAAVWFSWFLCGCLTGFVCRGRRSRTPPPLEGQLEAEWHRTRTGCVSRCDRPCVCTDPNLQGRPRKACSPGSPPRCPHRSSLLGFFSARQQRDNRNQYECYWQQLTYMNVSSFFSPVTLL